MAHTGIYNTIQMETTPPQPPVTFYTSLATTSIEVLGSDGLEDGFELAMEDGRWVCEEPITD